MLGRRLFLIACSGIVGAPAVAKAWPLLATSNRPRTPPADPLTTQALTDATQLDVPVLQIEGWDTHLASKEPVRSQVWIRINQSWRSAWR
jgi:hypothetical protein